MCIFDFRIHISKMQERGREYLNALLGGDVAHARAIREGFTLEMLGLHTVDWTLYVSSFLTPECLDELVEFGIMHPNCGDIRTLVDEKINTLNEWQAQNPVSETPTEKRKKKRKRVRRKKKKRVRRKRRKNLDEDSICVLETNSDGQNEVIEVESSSATEGYSPEEWPTLDLPTDVPEHINKAKKKDLTSKWFQGAVTEDDLKWLATLDPEDKSEGGDFSQRFKWLGATNFADLTGVGYGGEKGALIQFLVLKGIMPKPLIDLTGYRAMFGGSVLEPYVLKRLRRRFGVTFSGTRFYNVPQRNGHPSLLNATPDEIITKRGSLPIPKEDLPINVEVKTHVKRTKHPMYNRRAVVQAVTQWMGLRNLATVPQGVRAGFIYVTCHQFTGKTEYYHVWFEGSAFIDTITDYIEHVWTCLMNEGLDPIMPQLPWNTVHYDFLGSEE